MNPGYLNLLKKYKAEMVNACRLRLQITTLALNIYLKLANSKLSSQQSMANIAKLLTEFYTSDLSTKANPWKMEPTHTYREHGTASAIGQPYSEWMVVKQKITFQYRSK
jgi:hypothetical protein